MHELSRRDFLKVGNGLSIALFTGLNLTNTNCANNAECSKGGIDYPALYNELLNSYQRAVNVFAPEINKALNDFYKRKGYNALEGITKEEFYGVVNQVGSKIAETNEDVKRILTLDPWTRQYGLLDLVNRRLDMRRVKEEKRPIYVKDRHLPVFSDPELLFPSSYENLEQKLDPTGVTNAKLYQSKEGIWVVYLEILKPDNAFGELIDAKLWVPAIYFGSKPGIVGKELVQSDLDRKNGLLKDLNIIFQNVNTQIKSKDIQLLIGQNDYFVDRLSRIGLNREEIKEITYGQLRLAAEKVKREISFLNGLLSK